MRLVFNAVLVLCFWRGVGYFHRADLQRSTHRGRHQTVTGMGKGASQEMSQHMKECIERCLTYRLTFMKGHVRRPSYDTCKEYCLRELRLQRIKDIVPRAHATDPHPSNRQSPRR